MRLYDFPRSSSAWRVRVGIALKRVEVERVLVDVSRGAGALDQERPAYAEINPARQVPVLEWRERGELVRLGQSVAILEYLEQRFPEPALLPADARARARVRELVELINAGVQPLQNNYVLAQVEAAGGAPRDWARHFIGRGLGALEAIAKASSGPFLTGASVTLADVFLVPQLFNARLYDVSLDALPRLREAEAACAALPAFVSARPENQHDYVARFGVAR
ncbi:MAG: maleylacetoacetate isomerase [Myxococcales bacterium]|nr:maleylacetoacetate isomerase [Myxococcales bacterium]MCB9753306.1 maleylacetoacetate isomerase [Myxococcales bacterium]